MAEKYRPSNGTEGDGFIAAWCNNCDEDKNQSCDILGRTFAYSEDDPEYPTEWIYKNKVSCCTAFKSIEK